MGQLVNLNIIPKGIPDVVNASQYDVGRVIQFALYDGAIPYNIPLTATVQIAGKKGDNTIFCYDETDNVVSWSGNVVTITSTQQMTAYAGEVLAQLRVINSGATIATVNFKMLIQPRPDAEGDISETEIPAIIALAEAQELNAEAWAKGTKNGVPVTSSDIQYNDHAKYWAGQAREYAVGAVHYMGAVTFAAIPTTGQENGDMWNVMESFTTDNRFMCGSGVFCERGTNIIWDELNNLWDIAGGIGGVQSFNGRHGEITPASGDYSAEKISASMDVGGYVYTNVRDALEAVYMSIPSAQIQSDWAQTSPVAKDYIKNKPTIGTAAAKNVPASGNASTTEVVMGDDTRLTDARTPTAHTHNYAGSASAGGPANSVAASLNLVDSNRTLGFNGDTTRTLAFRNIEVSIYENSWSATPNSDGYYTQTKNILYISPLSFKPIIAIKDNATAAQMAAYSLCDKFVFDDSNVVSTVTVYAKTKPTADFHVTISGVYFA